MSEGSSGHEEEVGDFFDDEGEDDGVSLGVWSEDVVDMLGCGGVEYTSEGSVRAQEVGDSEDDGDVGNGKEGCIEFMEECEEESLGGAEGEESVCDEEGDEGCGDSCGDSAEEGVCEFFLLYEVEDGFEGQGVSLESGKVPESHAESDDQAGDDGGDDDNNDPITQERRRAG
jgi:hypothetical protein